MSDFDFDLFTIGAGSGGVRASRLAAALGARVAIAEEYRIGGTCVIRGCVPKKLLSYASHFSEEFEDAAGFGWTVEGAKFSWSALIANKDKEIARLSGIYQRNMEQPGVRIFEARAEVTGPNSVRLASGETFTAKRILVATGGRPQMPTNVEGVAHAISSNEAFHLKELPRHVTIVGAGYIAVEFAGIFNGLGSQVKLVHHRDQILRHFDEDLGMTLIEAMTHKGIDLALNCAIERIELQGGRKRVTLRDGAQFDTDEVMFATGRVPNTDGLGLETAGVKCSDNGAIVVDDYSRTNVPSVFAIGDVTDRLQLTPIAIREGMAFIETEFKNNPQKVDYANVATAIFSNPPIGTVGLTQAEAIKRYGPVDVYHSLFRPLKATLSGRADKTMMKLIVEAHRQTVLGCHIIGPDAPEMIQCLAVAVKLGATKRDFDDTVAVHPTAAEELVTMRSCVRVGA